MLWRDNILTKDTDFASFAISLFKFLKLILKKYSMIIYL